MAPRAKLLEKIAKVESAALSCDPARSVALNHIVRSVKCGFFIACLPASHGEPMAAFPEIQKG
jgi:hypothetical protein